MRILSPYAKEVRELSVPVTMKVDRGAFVAFLRLLQMLFNTVTAAISFWYHRWQKSPCATKAEAEAYLEISADREEEAYFETGGRGTFVAFLRPLQILFSTVTASISLWYHRWQKSPSEPKTEPEAYLDIPADEEEEAYFDISCDEKEQFRLYKKISPAHIQFLRDLAHGFYAHG